MACELTKTYGFRQPVFTIRPTSTGGLSPNSRFYTVFSEQWLDDQPRRLIEGGMSCQEALDFLLVKVPEWLSSRTIVKALSTMPACGGIGFNDVGNPNSSGFGGVFFEQYVVGEPFVGLTDIGQVLSQDNMPACEIDGDFNNVNYPVDGTWDLFTFGGYVGFPINDGSFWLPNLNVVDAIADIEAWFYCVMPACIPPMPQPDLPGSAGPGTFQIPRPVDTDPVQGNMSTPILNSLIKVSNHTYQFIRNFGRLLK